MDTGQIIFHVQGSAPTPYSVIFTKSDANLTATCTCQAGEMGQACKHRLNILAGSNEGVVSSNKDEIRKILSWLAGTDLEKALTDMRVAENNMEQTKKELNATKKKLAKYFTR